MVNKPARHLQFVGRTLFHVEAGSRLLPVHLAAVAQVLGGTLERHQEQRDRVQKVWLIRHDRFRLTITPQAPLDRDGLVVEWAGEPSDDGRGCCARLTGVTTISVQCRAGKEYAIEFGYDAEPYYGALLVRRDGSMSIGSAAVAPNGQQRVRGGVAPTDARAKRTE